MPCAFVSFHANIASFQCTLFSFFFPTLFEGSAQISTNERQPAGALLPLWVTKGVSIDGATTITHLTFFLLPYPPIHTAQVNTMHRLNSVGISSDFSRLAIVAARDTLRTGTSLPCHRSELKLDLSRAWHFSQIATGISRSQTLKCSVVSTTIAIPWKGSMKKSNLPEKKVVAPGPRTGLQMRSTTGAILQSLY